MTPIQDPEKLKRVGEFYNRVSQANFDYATYWFTHTFLHWDFFVTLLFCLIPWIVWIKVRKVNSTSRLLFAGFFVVIVSSWFDFLGTSFGLWYYTGKVLPTLPSYFPWDFCLLPVTVMLFIQIKPHMPAYQKAFLFSSCCAFVGETLFQWLGFYIPLHWNQLLSWLLYFAIYLVAHRLSKVKQWEEI